MGGMDDRAGIASHTTPETKRPWQTPEVITSDARGAGAQIAFGQDGSTPVYGPYGS